MKRIIRLTESDLTRIVRRVIKEQEGSSGPYLDLIGKTITLKLASPTEFSPTMVVDAGKLVLKGKIRNMVNFNDGDQIYIELEDPYVASIQARYSGYIPFGFDKPVKNGINYNIIYNCIDNTLITYLTMGEIQESLPGVNFTCKGLTDILSKRSPCVTDLSMNKNNVSNTTPNNLS